MCFAVKSKREQSLDVNKDRYQVSSQYIQGLWLIRYSDH